MMKFRDLLHGPLSSGTRSADFGLLIIRVIGSLSLALGHGLGKVPPRPGFIERVGGMGFPAPELFAWLAAFAEIGGGLLILIGLLTRPAALLVAVHAAIIAFLAHAGDPFTQREKGVLFMGIALLLVFAGAGRYSADARVFGMPRNRGTANGQ
jgi:putative oxidoreductase